ncbi:MAG: peptidoglycan DD-metalloendopeptidase family protein [Candidatus Omnitrophica bacterium]|nr:peptidoglycan DD-metalloendopeptidase family protein [Candidatus Omnitrophota bacterium]
MNRKIRCLPLNAPVMAVAAGTIYHRGYSQGAGRFGIVISHGDNMFSMYARVSPTHSLNKGDKVSQGDLIGHIHRSTPFLTHLHISLFQCPINFMRGFINLSEIVRGEFFGLEDINRSRELLTRRRYIKAIERGYLLDPLPLLFSSVPVITNGEEIRGLGLDLRERVFNNSDTEALAGMPAILRTIPRGVVTLSPAGASGRENRPPVCMNGASSPVSEPAQRVREEAQKFKVQIWPLLDNAEQIILNLSPEQPLSKTTAERLKSVDEILCPACRKVLGKIYNHIHKEWEEAQRACNENLKILLAALYDTVSHFISVGMGEIMCAAGDCIDKNIVTQEAKDVMIKSLQNMRRVIESLGVLSEVRLNEELHDIYLPGLDHVENYPEVMDSFAGRIRPEPIAAPPAASSPAEEPSSLSAEILARFARPIILLVLDKNGTLAPIAAPIEPRMAALLLRLVTLNPSVVLGIISGARLKSINEHITKHLDVSVQRLLYRYGQGGGIGFRPITGKTISPSLFLPLYNQKQLVDFIRKVLSDNRIGLLRFELAPESIRIRQRPAQISITAGRYYNPGLKSFLAEIIQRSLKQNQAFAYLRVTLTSTGVQVTVIDKRDALRHLTREIIKKFHIKTVTELLSKTCTIGDSESDVGMLNLVARTGGLAVWVGKTYHDFHPDVLILPITGIRGTEAALSAHISWLETSSSSPSQVAFQDAVERTLGIRLRWFSDRTIMSFDNNYSYAVTWQDPGRKELVLYEANKDGVVFGKPVADEPLRSLLLAIFELVDCYAELIHPQALEVTCVLQVNYAPTEITVTDWDGDQFIIDASTAKVRKPRLEKDIEAAIKLFAILPLLFHPSTQDFMLKMLCAAKVEGRGISMGRVIRSITPVIEMFSSAPRPQVVRPNSSTTPASSPAGAKDKPGPAAADGFVFRQWSWQPVCMAEGKYAELKARKDAPIPSGSLSEEELNSRLNAAREKILDENFFREQDFAKLEVSVELPMYRSAILESIDNARRYKLRIDYRTFQNPELLYATIKHELTDIAILSFFPDIPPAIRELFSLLWADIAAFIRLRDNFPRKAAQLINSYQEAAAKDRGLYPRYCRILSNPAISDPFAPEVVRDIAAMIASDIEKVYFKNVRNDMKRFAFDAAGRQAPQFTLLLELSRCRRLVAQARQVYGEENLRPLLDFGSRPKDIPAALSAFMPFADRIHYKIEGGNVFLRIALPEVAGKKNYAYIYLGLRDNLAATLASHGHLFGLTYEHWRKLLNSRYDPDKIDCKRPLGEEGDIDNSGIFRYPDEITPRELRDAYGRFIRMPISQIIMQLRLPVKIAWELFSQLGLDAKKDLSRKTWLSIINIVFSRERREQRLGIPANYWVLDGLINRHLNALYPRLFLGEVNVTGQPIKDLPLFILSPRSDIKAAALGWMASQNSRGPPQLYFEAKKISLTKVLELLAGGTAMQQPGQLSFAFDNSQPQDSLAPRSPASSPAESSSTVPNNLETVSSVGDMASSPASSEVRSQKLGVRIDLFSVLCHLSSVNSASSPAELWNERIESRWYRKENDQMESGFVPVPLLALKGRFAVKERKFTLNGADIETEWDNGWGHFNIDFLRILIRLAKDKDIKFDETDFRFSWMTELFLPGFGSYGAQIDELFVNALCSYLTPEQVLQWRSGPKLWENLFKLLRERGISIDIIFEYYPEKEGYPNAVQIRIINNQPLSARDRGRIRAVFAILKQEQDEKSRIRELEARGILTKHSGKGLMGFVQYLVNIGSRYEFMEGEGISEQLIRIISFESFFNKGFIENLRSTVSSPLSGDTLSFSRKGVPRLAERVSLVGADVTTMLGNQIFGISPWALPRREEYYARP